MLELALKTVFRWQYHLLHYNKVHCRLTLVDRRELDPKILLTYTMSAPLSIFNLTSSFIVDLEQLDKGLSVCLCHLSNQECTLQPKTFFLIEYKVEF